MLVLICSHACKIIVIEDQSLLYTVALVNDPALICFPDTIMMSILQHVNFDIFTPKIGLICSKIGVIPAA